MSAPWPKLKRDREGRRARTTRDITNNGGEVIKKGRVVRITDYFRGNRIETVRGPRLWITRVQDRDLELLAKK